jgi:hypothetical protein
VCENLESPPTAKFLAKSLEHGNTSKQHFVSSSIIGECLPFNLPALLYLCFLPLSFPLSFYVSTMLCPLGFKLLNCGNNVEMSSPLPSSRDALLSLFKVSYTTKTFLVITSVLGVPFQWLHLLT